MPSTRRVKVLAVTLALIIFSLFYLSSGSRQSNREFYDRTVAAMEAKAQEAAQAAHLIKQDRTPEIPRQAQGAKDTKDTKIRVKAEVDEGPREPPKVGTGGGKWDTGVEEEKEDPKSEEEKNLDSVLNDILKRSPIIIFSKSYCPHSKKAKHIFGLYSITPAPFIVELDQHSLGAPLQAALEKITGRRTVPNILISGTSIGGGDEIQKFHEQGDLVRKVRELGGKRIMEAKLKES